MLCSLVRARAGLNYSLSFVVLSKLGKIDGAYDSKATLLLPNFERTWQGALYKGHIKKRHPCPKNKQFYPIGWLKSNQF